MTMVRSQLIVMLLSFAQKLPRRGTGWTQIAGPWIAVGGPWILDEGPASRNVLGHFSLWRFNRILFWNKGLIERLRRVLWLKKFLWSFNFWAILSWVHTKIITVRVIGCYCHSRWLEEATLCVFVTLSFLLNCICYPPLQSLNVFLGCRKFRSIQNIHERKGLEEATRIDSTIATRRSRAPKIPLQNFGGRKILPQRKNMVGLGGGFKYFLFSPLPGEDFQFD